MADEKKKNVRRFAYQDVEATVGKMMTPSVKKLLEEDYKVDMATVLPVIHQSCPALDENETVEQYSRRCIESALVMQEQRKAVEHIENIRGKKQPVVVDLKNAAKKKEEPEKDNTEGAEVYAQANEVQKRFVMKMFGLSFKLITALVEDNNAAVKLNGDKAELVKLKPDEAAFIRTHLQNVEKKLEEAYTNDGVTLDSEKQKKEETKKPEPIVKKQEELSKEAPENPKDNDIVKLKNGKDLTFGDYKAALKKLTENADVKEMINEFGVNIDDVANEMFNKIETSAYEDALGVADASMQYVIARKVALNAYTRKTPGFQKIKNDEEKDGIKENRDGDPRNALFENMKDIFKFPFQAFKTILQGKCDEELKAEAERLNLKDVHLELSNLTRDALTKKLEKYESTLAKAVIEERDKLTKGKTGQNEPAKDEKAPAPAQDGTPGKKDDGTRTEEAPATTKGKKPMSEIGKKATRKVVDDTKGMGYGDGDGKRVTAEVENDMYPERAAEKGKTDPEHEDEYDPRDQAGKHLEGRGV